MQISLLGPLVLTVDGHAVEVSSERERAVLAMLALNAGRPVRTSELVDGVWGNKPPESAVRSLQSHLSRLRSKAGRDVVRTVGRDYMLDVPSEAVDVNRFEALVVRGRQLASSGAAEVAVQVLDDALFLWRGDPLPDLGDGPLAIGERARFEELKAGAQEERTGAMIATGDAGTAVSALERLVEEEPLRERRWELLIDALYATGREADALRAYQRARERLIDEAGVEPGPSLRAADARVIRQEPVAPVLRPVNTTVLPSGTVSLLLTDIEGSTALWDAHPDVMGAVVEHHTNLIGEAVVRHGGTLLKAKGEGDSTFSVFVDPDAAVAAAIDALSALTTENWDGGIELPVRIAVSTGPCEHRDGDYFGTTVNRAARVRGVAAGNDLLLSAATYNLVADTSLRHEVVTDLGLHELKGIQRPERIWQVKFGAELPAEVGETKFDAAAASDLSWAPSSIAGFVGRDEQREALARSWGKAQSGGLQVTLVSGEPGVGKTSLVGAQARRAVDDGGVVLFGRCPSDGLGSMTPIAEIVDNYVRRADPASVRAQLARMGAIASELLRIAPVLSDVVPELETPLSFDHEEDRRRLMSAVTSFIASIAVDAPVTVVIDDIHWSDSATIAAITHLVTLGSGDSSVFLVGTYRDTDVVRGHPFAKLREDIRRIPNSERIDLDGLDHAEVRDFLQVASQQELDAETGVLAELLWKETGGNPLFVGEVLAHLLSSGMIVRRDGRWTATAPVHQLPVPQGLAETIGHRLDQLSETANGVVRTAAVIGSRFDADLLGSLIDDPMSVLDSIDEAISAGLITESSTFGMFEFAHAVVRSTLVAELTMTRRVSMHWRIGVLMLERGNMPVESAFHLSEGVLAGDPTIAATAGLAAARKSSVAADQATAAVWATQSLDLLADVPDARELRADLLNERANATFMDWDKSALDARLAAVDAAIATGDPGRIGAAVRFVRSVELGVESPELTAAMARCLDALPDGERSARLKVLAAETHIGIMSGSAELARIEWCAIETLNLADPNDADEVVLAVQPFSYYGATLPALTVHQGRCLDMLDRIQPETLSRLQWNEWNGTRSLLLFLMGRLDESEEAFDAARRADPDLVGPLRVWICQQVAAFALARGDLRDIESAVDGAATEVANVLNSPETFTASMTRYMLGAAALHKDLLVEFEPFLAELCQTQPGVAWTSAHAISLAAAGRKQEAMELVDAVADDGFASLPGNSYAHGLQGTAIASILSGHLKHLPLTREKLSIHPNGLIGSGWGFWGSIRQTLGWISMALGESERALEELTLAARQFEAAGMRAFHAWATQDLAELHHSMGEVDTARQMATAARTEADECGAAMTVYRADLLLADNAEFVQ